MLSMYLMLHISFLIIYYFCIICFFIFSIEYIVSFNGYYLNVTRYNYISAALKSSSIKNWKILDRKNAASKYPSDFDVLFVNKNNCLISFSIKKYIYIYTYIFFKIIIKKLIMGTLM